MVEQNVRKALAVADRGYVLERGRVVAAGRPPLLARSSAGPPGLPRQGGSAGRASRRFSRAPARTDFGARVPCKTAPAMWQVCGRSNCGVARRRGRGRGVRHHRPQRDRIPPNRTTRRRATHAGPAPRPGRGGARRPRQPAPRDREGEAGAERPAHGAAARGERPRWCRRRCTPTRRRRPRSAASTS